MQGQLPYGLNILCCFKNIHIRVDVASRLGFGPQKLNSEFSTSWDNRHNIFETRLSLFGSEVTVAFVCLFFAIKKIPITWRSRNRAVLIRSPTSC